MQGIARVGLVVTVVAAMCFGGAGTAVACSCEGSDDVGSLENAEVVFVGTVVESIGSGTTVGSKRARWDEMSPWLRRALLQVNAHATIYGLSVAEVYRGELSEIAHVSTGGGCGFRLDGPGPFLVFAHRGLGGDPDVLTSGLCSGTRPLSDAPVPESFGSPLSPLSGADLDAETGASAGSTASDDGVRWAPVVAGALVLIGAVGAVGIGLRSRSRSD